MEQEEKAPPTPAEAERQTHTLSIEELLPPTAKRNEPSTEALEAKRKHDESIARMAKELASLPGVSQADARREAERLRAEAFGADGVPE